MPKLDYQDHLSDEFKPIDAAIESGLLAVINGAPAIMDEQSGEFKQLPNHILNQDMTTSGHAITILDAALLHKHDNLLMQLCTIPAFDLSHRLDIIESLLKDSSDNNQHTKKLNQPELKDNDNENHPLTKLDWAEIYLSIVQKESPANKQRYRRCIETCFVNLSQLEAIVIASPAASVTNISDEKAPQSTDPTTSVTKISNEQAETPTDFMQVFNDTLSVCRLKLLEAEARAYDVDQYYALACRIMDLHSLSPEITTVEFVRLIAKKRANYTINFIDEMSKIKNNSNIARLYYEKFISPGLKVKSSLLSVTEQFTSFKNFFVVNAEDVDVDPEEAVQAFAIYYSLEIISQYYSDAASYIDYYLIKALEYFFQVERNQFTNNLYEVYLDQAAGLIANKQMNISDIKNLELKALLAQHALDYKFDLICITPMENEERLLSLFQLLSEYDKDKSTYNVVEKIVYYINQYSAQYLFIWPNEICKLDIPHDFICHCLTRYVDNLWDLVQKDPENQKLQSAWQNSLFKSRDAMGDALEEETLRVTFAALYDKYSQSYDPESNNAAALITQFEVLIELLQREINALSADHEQRTGLVQLSLFAKDKLRCIAEHEPPSVSDINELPQDDKSVQNEPKVNHPLAQESLSKPHLISSIFVNKNVVLEDAEETNHFDDIELQLLKPPSRNQTGFIA